jgi:hypothetical protein
MEGEVNDQEGGRVNQSRVRDSSEGESRMVDLLRARLEARRPVDIMWTSVARTSKPSLWRVRERSPGEGSG